MEKATLHDIVQQLVQCSSIIIIIFRAKFFCIIDPSSSDVTIQVDCSTAAGRGCEVASLSRS